MKVRIFYFPQTTMIVQASTTLRFLECSATSIANLRGAKQRKKVRSTTADNILVIASKRELARVLVFVLGVIQRCYNHLIFINC